MELLQKETLSTGIKLEPEQTAFKKIEKFGQKVEGFFQEKCLCGN